ncbi:glutamine amidotransferase [Sphingomonas sp. BIUV-7]|uniref:Glutamine amidotransferase n=1 Tax=Sphingomonas natans TaxID=3063330 RepID=A0ABT8Y934_9SPHN|nr:glutamine amidotransferase [Sphingomonas sp. BIUV-7]MDO6414842.1 glutamine amidotransferase [Sphingomonas sp. BIUV-7]
MKRALIIRHVPYEGVAGFRLPIEQAGYEIDRIDVVDPAFPKIDLVAPDLLIMMGGPLGVYEQAEFPWIACQLKRLARRLEADRPTLGVCFGSQMMAAALGARVYPGPTKEVGFAPIALTPTGAESPLRHLAGVRVLHWHGDTFDLPERCEHLAETPRFTHQAFRRGRRQLALQFHAEMGEDPRIEDWLQAEDYIAAANTDVATIRADHASAGPAAVAAGRAMIAEWLAALA